MSFPCALPTVCSTSKVTPENHLALLESSACCGASSYLQLGIMAARLTEGKAASWSCRLCDQCLIRSWTKPEWMEGQDSTWIINEVKAKPSQQERLAAVTHGQLDDPATKKTTQMCWKRWKKSRVFIGTGGVLTGFRPVISSVTQLPLHNQCCESPFPQDVAMVLHRAFPIHMF